MKTGRRMQYSEHTARRVDSWVRRMVEIEFGTHYSRYGKQMGELLQDIKDHAKEWGIDYGGLYETVWGEAKKQIHADITKEA